MQPIPWRDFTHMRVVCTPAIHSLIGVLNPDWIFTFLVSTEAERFRETQERAPWEEFRASHLDR